MNYIKKIILILFINLIFAITGDELINQMENKPTPSNYKSNMTMTLTNKKGKVRISKIHSIIKDNGKKQIVWFLSPADDKGIAFLKIEHENDYDQMQIWLPAFKKIKRISSKKRSDSFMGSDMSYEDMSTRKKMDYNFNISKSEKYNNINCYILESIPKKNINSEYSKHYTWIDSSLLIPLKEISYDKNEKILKEKEFNYKQINSFHILNKIIVKNIQNNHSTKLIFDEIELNIKIKDDLFHERHLKRIPQL